nr:UvrD-helicase domain-containing protein [Lysinibacillus timonensis]
MFISSTMQSGAGLKYEIEVWNAIKKTFYNEEAFAIHHYPLFFKSGATLREIDILFVHQQLGLFVIEVKGLSINQIEKIQGHHWHLNDFRSESVAPFHQASQQMYMLVDDLNKNLLLGKRLNRFTLVALPMVTKAQWSAKGFNQQLNAPTPIFSDDLQNREAFKAKIESFTQGVMERPLSEQDWLRIQMYFNLDLQEKRKVGTTEDTIDIVREGTELRIPGTYEVEYKMQLFSRLYVFSNFEEFKNMEEEIKKLLFDGVKIYVLSYDEKVEAVCKKDYIKFLKAFQLNVYIGQSVEPLQLTQFDNGVGIDDVIDALSRHFKKFNKGQYNAIHLKVDENTHEMITAGAGTGKTHVMIDRIIYLLIHERVPLKDIIMITFTNASTNEMKKRLEEKFITLFDLTHQSKYLQYAEDVREMQISTIHSFAKKIIKQLAHEIGFGQNVKLRSFIYEKQLIVQKLVDEYFANKPVDFFKNHHIRYYELIKFVTDMWEEMEKKGLSQHEIKHLEWGKTNKESAGISEILQYIFAKCEEEINKIKQQQNAITMGDLIRKLKDFTNKPEVLKQLDENCFIFVDEFQDSDDVQIELIAKLQEVLNYNLFVVGDIKQSIYRFRGADYRSFDELDKRKKQGSVIKEVPLQYNYRSSKQLLDRMHNLFEIWGSMEDPLLTYSGKNDRLESFSPSAYGDRNWFIQEYSNKKDWKVKVRKLLGNAIQTRTTSDSKVAVIVRTNYQARVMKDICKDLDIATTENLDGTFFSTHVVKHFHMLIQGLLYPNEPKLLLNALETPYFDFRIPYHVLMLFKGDKDKLVSYISEKSKDVIQHYKNLLREHAPMAVIQTIIYESKILQRMQFYFERQGESSEVAKLSALKYERNLQHLMTIIEKNFNQQQLSLNTLLNWLTLQMNTNRSENEPAIDQNQAVVTITTVHRSKGLEYDTVILPISDYPYNKVVSKFYIQDSEKLIKGKKRKIGWKLKKHQNNYYGDLSNVEKVELMKEEVRLLYVAFTRAEQRIMVMLPEQDVSNSWSHLLKQAGLKGNEN